MAKAMVIVESPAKARTIEKYLGKDYTVLASAGHIKDLPKKTLGVDLEDDFRPTYQISTPSFPTPVLPPNTPTFSIPTSALPPTTPTACSASAESAARSPSTHTQPTSFPP